LESILKKSTTANENGPAIKITAKDIDVIMKAVEVDNVWWNLSDAV